jgi:transmembrane sensor
MVEEGNQAEDARAEAAQWFARLKTVPVSRATLDAFFAWRQEAGHGEAFEEIERLWTGAAALGDDPEIRAITNDAYDKGGVRRKANWTLRLLPATAAVAAIVAVCSVGLWNSGTRYATKVGERSVVDLEDGSKVTLDTDTELTVVFSREKRTVNLEHGQAYFVVAHNAARPFTVAAGRTDVLATGTQFDVHRSDSATVVTLVEGSVRVTPPGAAATKMVAGQQLRLSSGKAPQLHAADVTVETAWRRGRIVLDGVTLADAVAAVNRYTTRPLQLDATRLAGNRISGTFETGDIDSFVAAATSLLPLKAVRVADGSVRLIENPSGSAQISPSS